MLPYLIAGAIGFVVAKLFEEDEAPNYADGGSVLLAPNGKPSKLTPEQYKLVRTPEFKAWFGDWENNPANSSKVVDENGEPLVLYHFSTEKFNVFELKGNSDGFFFTPLKNDIEFSYKSNRKSYFLNIKILGVQEDIYQFNWSIPHYENRWIEDAKQNKENGIVFIKYVPYKSNQIKKQGKKIYVAFEPEQIKLADGTNTTFDGNNPDIRFKEGGEIKIDGNIFKVKIYLGDHSYDRETDKEIQMWFCRVIKMNGNDVDGILTEDNDLEGADIGAFDSRKKAKDFLLKYSEELNVILLDDNGIGVNVFSNNPDIRFKRGGRTL